MKKGSRLGGKVEELGDSWLEEVMGGAAINEDSEAFMADNTEEVKCLW